MGVMRDEELKLKEIEASHRQVEHFAEISKKDFVDKRVTAALNSSPLVSATANKSFGHRHITVSPIVLRATVNSLVFLQKKTDLYTPVQN